MIFWQLLLRESTSRWKQKVPVSDLPIADLLRKANELDRMAESARTADTRDALRRLAARYADLARTRLATGATSAMGIGIEGRPAG
jgi:hypothetical protein